VKLDRAILIGTMAANGEEGEDNLIRASQGGDTQAVEILFKRYRRPLLHAALRVTRSVEDAEDALQDGFLSAYRNLRNFQGRSRFCTWLTRIVINAALMKRRKFKVSRVVALEDVPQEKRYRAVGQFIDHGPDPEQICTGAEMGEIFNQSLEELSPLLRSAFLLRGLQGYSTREAAQALGVTENTFKARLWRARHQLAGRMEIRLRTKRTHISDDKSSSQNSSLPSIQRPEALGARHQRGHSKRVDRIRRQPLMVVSKIRSSRVSAISL
jgi:RNA polymerase sigma-70 factor, ECF subfamily